MAEAALRDFLGDAHLDRAVVAPHLAQDLCELAIRLRMVFRRLQPEPSQSRVPVAGTAGDVAIDEAVEHQIAGRGPARLVVPDCARVRVLEIEHRLRRMLHVNPVEGAVDRGALGVELSIAPKLGAVNAADRARSSPAARTRYRRS